MKEKVHLRDSTMKTKSHWLEIEHDGDYYVSLRTATAIIGGERMKVGPVILKSMTKFSPGVIVDIGHLRFYRTEEDVRISFTREEALEGLSGFDRVDHDELVAAIEKIVGKETHESPRKKKAAASKPKRRVAKATTKRTK